MAKVEIILEREEIVADGGVTLVEAEFQFLPRVGEGINIDQGDHHMNYIVTEVTHTISRDNIAQAFVFVHADD